MAIFRVEKKDDYTVMSNHHLRNKNLSLKAKGLLSYMLSLPDDWDYSMEGLSTINKESTKTIKNILEELKDNYYLTVNKIRNSKGQYEYEYLVYENPHTQKPPVVKPEVDNPQMDNPPVESYRQLNTNIQSTNILNTNKQNTKNNIKEKYKEKYFDNQELNDIFLEFLKLRKKIKAINSERAINSLIKELNQYDDDIKMKMIEKSIRNSWKDVYPLKKEELPQPKQERHYFN